eukprot:249121-Chlamydomonas_euryale.AAC.15
MKRRTKQERRTRDGAHRPFASFSGGPGEATAAPVVERVRECLPSRWTTNLLKRTAPAQCQGRPLTCVDGRPNPSPHPSPRKQAR